MTTSNTITKTDLENIINAIFPATSEDMTQAQIDAFVAGLAINGGQDFPIKFKFVGRQVTQSGGVKDYWTMPDPMPPKLGHTRVPIAYGTTNGALCPVGTLLDTKDNSVKVQSYNYSSSSVTATLYCFYLWVRDDMMET